MIAAVGLVLAPALFLTSIYRLSDGLNLGSMSVVEWGWTVVTLGLTALVIRLTFRELRWATGVVLDEQGIACGKLRIAWDEVERLEAPRFGILVVAGGGRELQLRTYLFRNRKALLEHIGERTDKPVPEMAYSY